VNVWYPEAPWEKSIDVYCEVNDCCKIDALIAMYLRHCGAEHLHMIHQTAQYEVETKSMRAKVNFTSSFVTLSSHTGQ
jgi:hypothetical protein